MVQYDKYQFIQKFKQSFCEKYDEKALAFAALNETEKRVVQMSEKVNSFDISPKKNKPKQNKRQTNRLKKFTIAVWGFYEDAFKCNWIFFTPNSAIGDNILKPMNDFYRIASQNNINLKTLDTIKDFTQVDAFLFWDFPQIDSYPVKKALSSNKPCYLVVAESPIIRPENWLEENHKYFTKIFTYYDDIVDHKQYFKLSNDKS